MKASTCFTSAVAIALILPAAASAQTTASTGNAPMAGFGPAGLGQAGSGHSGSGHSGSGQTGGAAAFEAGTVGGFEVQSGPLLWSVPGKPGPAATPARQPRTPTR